MANSYLDRLKKRRGTDFYGGRSPQDEILYGFDTTTTTGGNVPVLQASLMQGFHRPNPNFSVLNTAPFQTREISSPFFRNKLFNQLGGSYSDQATGKKSGMPPSSVTVGKKQTASKTPPNWKDNLLNYVLSPKGRGMAQGLLEASGYSEVPVTFGQALSMGMKRGTEAETAADAKALAERQELMNNLLTQSQIYKNYQPSGKATDKYRPMTKEEKLSYGIPENVPARYNITSDKPEIMSTGAKTSVTSNVTVEAEGKGTEDFFEGRGKDFSQTITNIGNISSAADIDNQALNRFEQLSELAKTGKTSELLSDIQGWADSLGLDLSGLDLANMGATQALNSVAGRFVMQQVQKTKGAVSDREMAYFMKISANIGNSPLGNQLIINMARSMNNRTIDENNLLQTFLSEQYAISEERKAKGEKPLSGYALELAWNKEKEKFRKENQLFTGDIKDEIKAFYKENDIEYVDSTKKIEETLSKYPKAKYTGVADDGTLEFTIVIDGKEHFLYIEA